MPYSTRRKGTKVQLLLRGKVVGTHRSAAAAERQRRAIEASKRRRKR